MINQLSSEKNLSIQGSKLNENAHWVACNICNTDVHQWIVKMKQAKFKNCSNILLSINNDYIVIVCIDSISRSISSNSAQGWRPQIFHLNIVTSYLPKFLKCLRWSCLRCRINANVKEPGCPVCSATLVMLSALICLGAHLSCWRMAVSLKEDYGAVQDYYCCPSFILKIIHAVGSERDTLTGSDSRMDISFYNSYYTQTCPNGLSSSTIASQTHTHTPLCERACTHKHDRLISQTLMKTTVCHNEVNYLNKLFTYLTVVFK